MLNYSDSVYEGEFLGGMFHGRGKLTTENGFYMGEFKTGHQDGYGEFHWQDGSIYRGNYKDGGREGEGEYFNAKNKSISKGLWKKGMLNGHGQYTDPYGNSFKCIWDNGHISALVE